MPASNQPRAKVASWVSGAGALRAAWFSDTQLVEVLNEAFDRIGFTEEYLTAHRPTAGPSSKRKAIKDAVWGMIEFDGPSMRLVDSPILQRLRRINQLGFSYITYPSAEHSRFIHSIGMANVVDRFVQAINRDHQEDGVEFAPGVKGYASFKDLKPLRESEIIHAALLHDVGHLPFSHVAEAAIVASPSFFRFGSLPYSEFVGKAELHLGKKISLSEALSILVVLSDRFGRYYREHIIQREDDDALLRIACLIAGQRVQEKCPNIQHIISSSAVDADKIDYVTRDSEACGIPVGVDVSRVFLGSGILEIDKTTALELSYLPGDRYVFALNASGWDTFDEIIRARSTLYQRVYLHPVTRTAEALFARALRLNAAASERGAKALADVVSLWAECDSSVLDALGNVADPEIKRIAYSLRDRWLPKKACALASDVAQMHMPICDILPETFSLNQMEFSARQNWIKVRSQIRAAAVEGLVRDRDDTIDAVTFEDQVRLEAERLAEFVSAVRPSLAPTMPLSSVALIHIAALDSQKSNAPVFQNGEIVTADEFTNARGVVDAAEIFRSIGYVMSTEGWTELVLIATRRVLYQRSLSKPPIDVTLALDADGDAERIGKVQTTAFLDSDGIVRRVGVSRRKLNELYEAAETAGYFDSCPLLARRHDPDDCSAINDRYSKFDGEDGWQVTARSIAAFLDQFPPSLRPAMSEALENGIYLAQNKIAGKLRRSIDAVLKDYPEAVILPLSSSSGGNAVAAVKPKLTGRQITYANDLRSALDVASDSRPIIFVDDNAASGVQSSAQLFAYAQIPRSKWPPSLRKETGLFEIRLTETELRKWKQTPFAVAVAIGHSAASERLRASAGTLQLEHFLGLHYDQEIGALEWAPDLRAFLTSIGQQLIAGDRYEKPLGELSEKERSECDQYAFGYGNFGGLTVAPFNVPASTVTALWMPGVANGRPWMPLFIRRGRLDNLIIA